MGSGVRSKPYGDSTVDKSALADCTLHIGTLLAVWQTLDSIQWTQLLAHSGKQPKVPWMYRGTHK